MLKRIWIAMLALCVFVAPARAELKVDIIAGAAEPISIAIQKFETGDGVRAKDAAMMREVVEMI